MGSKPPAASRLTRAQPATRVMILTTFGLDSHVYQALRVGSTIRPEVGGCGLTAANLVLFRAARNVDRGA